MPMTTAALIRVKGSVTRILTCIFFPESIPLLPRMFGHIVANKGPEGFDSEQKDYSEVPDVDPKTKLLRKLICLTFGLKERDLNIKNAIRTSNVLMFCSVLLYILCCKTTLQYMTVHYCKYLYIVVFICMLHNVLQLATFFCD